MTFNNPLNQKHASALERVLAPDTGETGNLGRRKFLIGMGVALAAGGLPSNDAGGAEAEKKTSVPKQAETEKSLIEETEKGKWVVHRSEAEKNGEGDAGAE